LEFFNEKNWLKVTSLYQKCSVGLKYHMPKCVGRRSSAQHPAGGAHDALPDPLVGWGGGHPLPIPTTLGDFGAQLLCLPLWKILADEHSLLLLFVIPFEVVKLNLQYQYVIFNKRC